MKIIDGDYALLFIVNMRIVVFLAGNAFVCIKIADSELQMAMAGVADFLRGEIVLLLRGEGRRRSPSGHAGDARLHAGAGEGNRTLVVSLGSFCSTIELHPRSPHFTRDMTCFVNLTNGRCDGKCDGRFLRSVMACVQIHWGSLCWTFGLARSDRSIRHRLRRSQLIDVMACYLAIV